jgi:outer membrane protein assembly factor BamB
MLPEPDPFVATFHFGGIVPPMLPFTGRIRRWAGLTSYLPVTVVVAALLSPLSSAMAASEPWKQWRGPSRDGLVRGARWPESISTNHLKVRWRVELGPSYSGPIFWGDRTYTTETANKKLEVVKCFDLSTGKQLWTQSWEGAVSVPFFAKSNGDWIRSTPSTDGERVYVGGMRDVVVCLEAATGKVLWRYDFVQELKTAVPDFGMVCSPLVEGDSVYVQAGGGMACLDRLTGKLRWRALQDGGGMNGSAFSSPVSAELLGRRQILVQGREKLSGLDPADGTVLWSQPVEAFRGMNILTPIVYGNQLFTSTYGGKTTLYQLAKEHDGWAVSNLWTLKTQGYMSSPVIIGEVAYHHLKSERMTAINLKTGKELWTTAESFGKYMSEVAQGDRILGLDQRGWLYLIRANPEKFDLIEKRRLTESETWAHLAVGENLLLVRELHALAAYDWN